MGKPDPSSGKGALSRKKSLRRGNRVSHPVGYDDFTLGKGGGQRGGEKEAPGFVKFESEEAA